MYVRACVCVRECETSDPVCVRACNRVVVTNPDNRRFGVSAVAQAITEACSHGDDVLESTAELDTSWVRNETDLEMASIKSLAP